ncbi:MAG: SAM-dependent DNA methyltransferase, partial [Opitutae bacterium]|nr:SAM-dependent DNA methyltransferase [Opitutae bacterium]
MPSTLSKDQRSILEKITLKARDAAEVAARAALDNLAVHEERPRAHLNDDQRRLRNRLRARGRALGDRLDPGGTQSIDQLAEAAAYQHWHLLLFTRVLADNHLLHTGAEHGRVPVTLEDCDELAAELGARDGFELACRFAAETLPGIFRPDDPALDLRLAPNHEVQLRRLLDELPAEIFRTDDALGWTYQFWQAKRKDEVNKSGVKIGARELPAVTQLFTEDYMVEFLLHNALGAWWAAKESGRPGPSHNTEAKARLAASLPPKDGLPGIDWTYLRFVKEPGHLAGPGHPAPEKEPGHLA